MPLQGFVANTLPTIKAAWLNKIDILFYTVFNQAQTVADARVAINAAEYPVNADITEIQGLTTPLTVAQGGSGSATAAGAPWAVKGVNSDLTALTAMQYQTGGTTTAGTSTAYTLAASACAAYVTGMRFRVKFHTANGAAPTIAINGLAALNLVRQGNDGVYTNLAAASAYNIVIGANTYHDIEIVSGTQALVHNLPPRRHFIVTTRDISVASGDVAHTGVGFMPSQIRLIGQIQSTNTRSHGWTTAAGVSHAICQHEGNGGYSDVTSGYLGVFNSTAGVALTDYSTVDLKSYDADGFTVTWTKNAGATGTANLVYSVEE